MKLYNIVLDGIDKTGKDTIRQYIFYLQNAKYICNTRGYMAMKVYSKLYNRDYEYDIENQKYILNVLLTADKEDWEIRCKITNEPKIDYEQHSKEFYSVYEELTNAGYHTLIFNTSRLTPCEIAKKILEYINNVNSATDK